MNPYQVVNDFEQAAADYSGSKYAVSLDNCTNALFLCCTYLKVKLAIIPKQTYVAVPCSIIHAGGKVQFEELKWEGSYQIKPYPIWDSAGEFTKGMYEPGTYRCLSFSMTKPIKIGKGGMILHDNDDADKWFRSARYLGRNEADLLADTFTMLGWNMYMTPEQAARGLNMMLHVSDKNIIKKYTDYPDLSQFPVYQK